MGYGINGLRTKELILMEAIISVVSFPVLVSLALCWTCGAKALGQAVSDIAREVFVRRNVGRRPR